MDGARRLRLDNVWAFCKRHFMRSQLESISNYRGIEQGTMDYDKEKVDEMVLALMWLVTHGDKYRARAWK
jgi:hypothetical protein